MRHHEHEAARVQGFGNRDNVLAHMKPAICLRTIKAELIAQ